jgi:hypothetical protein
VASQNFVTRPGSQFVQSGTGAVERTVDDKLRDVVSVKDFGAVGDGVTDDTVAIQAALNTTTKAIYFPQGTYVVASPNTTPALTSAVADRRIYGEGKLTALATVRKAFYVTGNRTEFSLGCAGNNKIGVFAHFFCEDPFVHHCVIENLYSPANTGEVNGVRITLDGLTAGAVITDNVFTNLESVGDSTGANGVGMARAITLEADSTIDAPIYIANNTIRTVIGEEGDAIVCISSNGAGTYYKLNLIIQNNTIFNFNRRGIKIQCSGANIIGNTLKNTWTADQGNMQGGIDLVQGGDHIVSGNILSDLRYLAQIKAIEDVAPINNIAIIDNVIQGIGAETTASLIYINTLGGSNVVIKGNTINCSAYADACITVVNSDGVYVADNTVISSNSATAYDFNTSITNLQTGINHWSGRQTATYLPVGTFVDSALELEVNGTVNKALKLINSDTTLSDGELISQLQFHNNDNNADTVFASLRAVAVGSSGSTALDIHTGSSNSFSSRFSTDGSFYCGGTTRITTKFGFDLTRNALIIYPTTAPASPAAGWVYYDNSLKKLRVYNGTAWETITST